MKPFAGKTIAVEIIRQIAKYTRPDGVVVKGHQTKHKCLDEDLSELLDAGNVALPLYVTAHDVTDEDNPILVAASPLSLAGLEEWLVRWGIDPRTGEFGEVPAAPLVATMGSQSGMDMEKVRAELREEMKGEVKRMAAELAKEMVKDALAAAKETAPAPKPKAKAKARA
jgi:hypothetical protein